MFCAGTGGAPRLSAFAGEEESAVEAKAAPEPATRSGSDGGESGPRDSVADGPVDARRAGEIAAAELGGTVNRVRGP